MKEYTCVRCGKKFEAKVKTLVCADCHTGVCVVCGKEFDLQWPWTQMTCSSKCRGDYRKTSGIAKQAAETAKKTIQYKYNVDNVSQLQKFIKVCKYCGQTFETTSSRRIYCNRPHFGPCPVCGKLVEIKEMYIGPQACSEDCRLKRIETTCLQKYDDKCAVNSKHGREVGKKTCMNKYGVDHFSKSVLFPSREIAIKAANGRSNIVASDGTHLDSSYELKVYEYCMRNNLEFDIQVPIKFDYQGKDHFTFVDFYIDDLLIECKGSHLLKGCFSETDTVPIQAKIDVYKHNDIIVVTDKLGRSIFGKPNSTQSNGLKYKHKCPYPLIGVDIELFENPEFPYRDDRPRCFYDVKVDGQMSAFEAFQDEKLRWKMIKNRIQYSGGFIDANQILNALNITRTCKQPSWFSKSLAKHIISEYCSSDIIVDPFAGWGARADAANELHRTYIGCDFNKELVEWHHSKGRTNIQYGDANEFKFGAECSVFICPPYSDPKTGRCFEDYNFEGFDTSAKAITQCQWLQIVMNNVPNAKEYIMVCKIVDPGWEQYIVDTKVNKSHFGVNNEYVLVVHNVQP